MKFKKILAISLSTTLMMSAVPAYADEEDLVTFEDSQVSVEETDDNSVSFDDSEYDEEVAETENFSSGDEEFQIIDNDFVFSDGTDEIQMAGIAADNTAPVLESLRLDKTEAAIGDVITITAKITDESALKGKPQIAFYQFNGSLTETGATYSTYLTSQGNDIYTGTITVTDSFVNGYYPAQWLSVTDIYDNKKIYNLENLYPNLGFTVHSAQEDHTAPALESLEADKTEVTVGDVITITAKITDESALKGKPQIAFYQFNGSLTETGATYNTYLTSQGNDIYTGTITVTDSFVNGYYPAQWLSVTDIYDNKKTYDLEKLYPNLGFTVTGAQEDHTAPVLENLKLNKTEATENDVITITAKITDESALKGKPQIAFYQFNGSLTETGATYSTYLTSQGNDIYTGTITVTDSFVNGYYPAQWLSVTDIYDNKKIYDLEKMYPNLGFRVLCDNHTWDQGTITQNATCTDNGEKQYTCTVCGTTKTEVILATGHKKVIDPAVSPTCENTGKTEGSHCFACGDVIVPQNILPATGHSWDSGSVTLKPTCENTGIKTYTCATCGKTKTETISALGHKEVTDPAVNATCEADGKTEGIHCSVCGKVLIPQNVIPATGHSWDNGKITKDATCEIPGSITYTCTTCNKTKTEVIAALGHKPVTDPAVAATCEADGKTEGSHCSICGKILVTQETIPAIGHSWDNGKITKEASCTEAGIKTFTCTNCQKTKVENINAVGHKYSSWKISSPATVFAPEKQVRTCSACGKEEQKEVGSQLQKTMKISATSVPLKAKQKTTALKVTGLAEGDSIISWKSNNTKIATISGKPDGTCTIKAGKKTGKAKITITLKSGLQKTVTVSVQKGTVRTKKITGIAKSLKLKKKQKTVLHPVIAPFTGTEKVTYKSSNSKIATVNSKGQITAKKKGTAIITVKSGSKSVKCKVTVK